MNMIFNIWKVPFEILETNQIEFDFTATYIEKIYRAT